MKRKFTFFGRPLAVAVLFSLTLSACGGDVGKVLGLESDPPDEFSVVKRAPLTLPPDYGLRPPAPGQTQRNSTTPRELARKALLGAEKLTKREQDKLVQKRRAQGQDESEIALLVQAKALNATPEIRVVVNEESRALVSEQESFVDDLLFWKNQEPAGAIVDASGENRRLQENAGLGKSVTEGETPTILRESEAPLFEWPF